MKGRLLKRPHQIALVFVTLLVLIVFNLPGGTIARFKLAISGMFVPLFGVAGSAQQLANQSGNLVLPRRELIRQNEQLRRENQQLQLRAAQAEEILLENHRLREHVGWQKQAPWKLKLARIVARDPANWWRTVQIDAGSRDGVQIDMPVLSPRGALAGRVVSVGRTRSQVVLLGDPNLRVGSIIQETRETGVIVSSGEPINDGIITLAYLFRNSNAKPGQTVETSGEGGVFPKGIPIGQIVDLRTVDGIATEARVKLAADFKTLEEVWVKFP